VNPPALYDALNCASLAVLLAESGDAGHAESTLTEASLAAVDAFPAGSPEAVALGVILAAAGRVSAEVAL
jgi:predicted RNA polymerase sigma factor